MARGHLSRGSIILGGNCPGEIIWGQFSSVGIFWGVIVRGAIVWGVIVWGQLSGRSISGSNCLGAIVLGSNCPGGDCPGGELSFCPFIHILSVMVFDVMDYKNLKLRLHSLMVILMVVIY